MKEKNLDVLYNTLIEDVTTCIMEYNHRLKEEKNIKK